MGCLGEKSHTRVQKTTMQNNPDKNLLSDSFPINIFQLLMEAEAQFCNCFVSVERKL